MESNSRSVIASEAKIPWGWIATRSEARLRLLKPLNLETTMLLDHPSDGLTAIRRHIGAIFVSLELSRSNWLVTSLSPGKDEKMSRHSIAAGNVVELLTLFADAHLPVEMLNRRSAPRTNTAVIARGRRRWRSTTIDVVRRVPAITPCAYASHAHVKPGLAD